MLVRGEHHVQGVAIIASRSPAAPERPAADLVLVECGQALSRLSWVGRAASVSSPRSPTPARAVLLPAQGGHGRHPVVVEQPGSCSPVGSSMPERAHGRVVVLLAAHAGLGHGAAAVAHDQLPA